MNPNETLIYRNGVNYRGTRTGEPRRLPDITGQGIPWLTSDEQAVPFTAKRPEPVVPAARRGDCMSILPIIQLVNACMDGDLL